MSRSSALILVVALVSWAAHAAPAPAPAPEPDEPELMLMAVSLDFETLSDAMPCYVGPGVVLAPLGQLSAMLGLAISVRPDGLAEGWAYSAGRRFRIDPAALESSFDGKRRRLKPAQISVRDGDLYVDLTVLSQVLPIDFDVGLRSALIRIRAREPLPVELAKDRQRRIAIALAARGANAVQLPRLEIPYSAFALPSLEETVTLNASRQPDGTLDRELRYSTHLTGELLFLQAEATISGEILTPLARPMVVAAAGPGLSSLYSAIPKLDPKVRPYLPEIRFRLGRRDPDGQLLGPLHATEIGVGDLGFPGVDLISAPAAGPGFLLTNRPLMMPDTFDHHTFVGDLPPGWEVELFWNGGLVGYQASRPDGRYEFVSVALGFGSNVFRLVFHGPHGEIREEEQRFEVGMQAVPRGKLYYRLTGNAPLYTGRRSLAALDYGVTRNLSVGVSLATVAERGRERVFQETALRGYWRFLAGTIELATELGGGAAAMARVQAQLGTVRLSVERDQLWNYQSEFFAGAGPLTSRSSVKVDGAVPMGLGFKLPLSLELRRDELKDGSFDTRVLASSISQFRTLAVSQTLMLPLEESRMPASGQSAMSWGVGPIELRGTASYDLRPHLQLTNASVGVQSRGASDYMWSAGVTRTASELRYEAAVGKTAGSFGATLSAGYSQRSGVSVSLSFSIALERDERRGSWHPDARDVTASGAISARAFLDSNGDGRMNKGEQPLTGVQFEVNGTPAAARTGSDGVAVLDNLSTQGGANIAILGRSLSDPFLKPVGPGFRVVPRAGRMGSLEFPVAMTGEVAGTLYERVDGRKRPLAGVEIEVTAADGRSIKARTAYDGYYDVPDLVPGRYTLQVAPQAHGAQQWVAAARALNIGLDGTVLDGQDLVLEQLQAATSAVAKSPAASDELRIPANPEEPFELRTPEGATLRVKAVKTMEFALVSWVAGLPLSAQEVAGLDQLGAAVTGSPTARVVVISHAQTMGPAEGAMKRAAKGANLLKRYLQAVAMVPAKRIHLSVVAPGAASDPLGHVQVLLVEPVQR